MKKVKEIKAGYRLSVTSWENDADNYQTKIKEGLSEDQTRLYLDLCKLHTSRNDRKDPGFGNLFEPDDEIIALYEEAVAKILSNHGSSIDHGDVDDLLGDLGLVGSSEFYTRVLDNFEVDFIEKTIQIEDVTKKFK